MLRGLGEASHFSPFVRPDEKKVGDRVGRVEHLLLPRTAIDKIELPQAEGGGGELVDGEGQSHAILERTVTAVVIGDVVVTELSL